LNLLARVAGRLVPEGEGVVKAHFRRSFYLQVGARYACVGDPSIGRGPLNALVDEFRLPAPGEGVSLSVEEIWTPPALPPHAVPDLRALRDAARGRVPNEGLGCLVIDAHNSLSGHAQPALEALERWLVGNAMEAEAEQLIGLGPGLTPSGDDYLGGMLLALHQLGRAQQARGLWRWLEPRLARTSEISAAHLAAAAAGEAHEALHAVLAGDLGLEKLDAVGHTSGWDSLAGIAAVLRSFA
jgi:hypothetical protein